MQGRAQFFNEKDFVKYSVRDGLTDNQVMSIAQDERGYIWAGTVAGLNRFDGHSFKTFNTSSSCIPLLSSHIIKLKKLRLHQLGVLSRLGVQLINTQHLAVENYSIPDSSSYAPYLNGAWDAEIIGDTSLGVTTSSGFHVFNSKGNISFKHEAYSPPDAQKKRILYGRDIIPLGNNQYLVYVEDNKLAIYKAAEKKFTEIDSASREWKPFYSAHTPNGEFWEGHYQIDSNNYLLLDFTKNNIVLYNRAKNSAVTSQLPFHCLAELSWESRITMLDSGRFAINCSNYGFYVFHINWQTGVITSDGVKSLPATEVFCLFFDRDNRLWVGTPEGLLRQRLKKPLVNVYSFQPGTGKSAYPEALSCAYRYKNKLYVGNYSPNTGLAIIDPVTMQMEKQIHFFGEDNMWNEVISIQMYYADTLWLGTNGGLLWFDTKTGNYGDVTALLKNIPGEVAAKIKYTPGRASIVALSPVNKDGNTWFCYGLRGVVARYNIASRNITFFTDSTKPALPFNGVKQIVYDSSGDVWISGLSLARWSNKSQSFDTLMSVYGGRMKFNSNILAITGGNDGSVWMHNDENGLLEYRPGEKKFIAYDNNQGLPSNIFEAISPVVNHVLWLVNNTTLTSFNTITKKATVYDYNDGVSISSPSGRKIYYDSTDKVFYFFCESQLARFPATVSPSNLSASDIIIEQFSINNNKTIFYPPNGISVSPDSNNISISFSVIDFESADGYNFAYRLNKAPSFTPLGQQRILTLNSLPPGHYNILLKATSKTGEEKIQQFSFIIRPHFWQTVWFWALVAGVAVITLYLLYRRRIQQIHQKANIDKQLAQMEMKALHAQMNPHFIFNSLNSIKEMVLNNENAEASNFLSKFARLIRITLEQSAHAFVTLRSTVDYLSRYIEMEKIRNSNFSSSIMVEDSIDQDDTILPPMLIQPFIENAIWHGITPQQKAIHINVSFKKVSNVLVCVVDDDGIGIGKSMSAKQRNVINQSYGIKNIQERINLLNEKYNLRCQLTITDKAQSSQDKTGTVVTLEMPLQTQNE